MVIIGVAVVVIENVGVVAFIIMIIVSYVVVNVDIVVVAVVGWR